MSRRELLSDWYAEGRPYFGAKDGSMKKFFGLPRVAFPLSMIVVAGGCVSATFVPTQGGMYPPKNRYCDIQVFSSTIPDQEYEEIGIVEGEGSAWKSDLEDVLPKIMEEGCLAGGDALIMQSSDTYSSGGRDGFPVQRISATVIRWSSE